MFVNGKYRPIDYQIFVNSHLLISATKISNLNSNLHSNLINDMSFFICHLSNKND